MRWVQAAAMEPHRCAVVPFIGHTHERGFIDTGSTLEHSRVYVSVVGAEQMAAMLDWQPPQVVAQLQELAAVQARRIEQLEAANGELQARFDAIDVLGSAGFTARRKPGRKAQTVEGKVAA